MRYLSRALLAGGLGFATSFIAACGGGAGLLSSNQAGQLNNQLSQISSGLAAGNCNAVQSGIHGLDTAVANLPTTVNDTLRQDLDQGANTVGQLAVRQCHQAATTTTPTTTTSTTTTTAATTNTNTTPSTQTSTTTTATTPATTPTTTGTNTGPSGGGGLGGTTGAGSGSGGGNGNGNG